MNKQSIAIRTDWLKASLLFVSKEATRYNLNGVAVQCDRTSLHLIATDGHRLIACRADYGDVKAESFKIIIPSAIVKTVTTGKRDMFCSFCILEHDADKWILDRVGFDPIDGTFPDWRRVVPAGTSGESAMFNGRYVGDLAKANKILGGNEIPGLCQSGPNPALVTFSQGAGDVLAVLMPDGQDIKALRDRAAGLAVTITGKRPVEAPEQESAAA
jgi:DNA polymerase-3 subunit beta